MVRDGQVIAYQKPGIPLYRTVGVDAQPNQTCEHAWITEGIPFFIPDAAPSPYPLKKGQELWVDVTVPPAGPPRALALAIRENGRLTPLRLR